MAPPIIWSRSCRCTWLDLSDVVTHTVPLGDDAINEALEALHQFGGEIRTVIMP